MPNRKLLWWVLVGSYLAGLALLGVYFRNALNTDAVAYLRLAHYYAAGNLDLAVSGYWGPLLSWLMAPLLKAGLSKLAAGRLAMGFSALVFLAGSVAAYRAFKLPEMWVRTGALLTAACGLYWSVRFITPDLLLSGLVAIAVCCLMKGEESPGLRHALAAGLFWGLAYLTKAIAFPLATLTTLIFGAMALLSRSSDRSVLLRKLGVTILAFGLVAGPWMTVISVKYGRPTFSTAARISHALTGPGDLERYHPFARTFHRPEPGRISSWEDPSNMAYHYWSPFQSPAYAWHQIRVMLRNLVLCLLLLTSLNAAWLILPFHILRAESGKNSVSRNRQCWQALIVPLCLLVLYLPASIMVTEQRFFYPAFPFLLIAVALWAMNTSEAQESSGLRWRLVMIGIAAPLIASVVVLGASPKFAGDCAVDLADRMRKANLAGPIAGSGLLRGGRAGLYVAFLLNQPWYGDEIEPTPDSLRASGARFVVVVRQSELGTELERDPHFVDRDEGLFGTSSAGAGSSLKLYEIKGWREAADR
jgi:hypothetical protein